MTSPESESKSMKGEKGQVAPSPDCLKKGNVRNMFDMFKKAAMQATVTEEQEAACQDMAVKALSGLFKGLAFTANFSGIVIEKSGDITAATLRTTADAVQATTDFTAGKLFEAGAAADKKSAEYASMLPAGDKVIASKKELDDTVESVDADIMSEAQEMYAAQMAG